mgnify:CR=1 FL=1
MIKVIIGIQARSNSTRLSGKAYKIVGESSIIHRVIYHCVRAAGWLQKDNPNVHVKAVLLIPEGDPLKSHVEHKIEVFEGSEDDVLARYSQAANHFDADYMVRITGDCAWLHSKTVSKCVREALHKEADYTSNILVRTFIEGQDTEVLSRRCLHWLDRKMITPQHREHVTLGLLEELEQRRHLPLDYKIHTLLNDYDLSDIKTSVDTQEEYESACALFEKMTEKKRYASERGTVNN